MPPSGRELSTDVSLDRVGEVHGLTLLFHP